MSAITDDRGRPAPGTPAVSKAVSPPAGRITVVRNAGGRPLSKSFSWEGGRIVATPAAQMADGEGRVLSLGPEALAARLNRMPASQAVVPGVPKAGAERFGITTKDRERSGATLADGRPILARTKANFDFPEGPAWMGLDFDTGDMSPEVAELIPGNGDLLDPNILGYDGVARVERSSASAGLVGPDGAEKASANRHVYLLVKDGTDIPRVAEALFVRSAIRHKVLHAKVSKAGTVLIRGLFDLHASASPERLWFEGDTPLFGRRDAAGRRQGREGVPRPGVGHAGGNPGPHGRGTAAIRRPAPADHHREETRGRPGEGRIPHPRDGEAGSGWRDGGAGQGRRRGPVSGASSTART